MLELLVLSVLLDDVLFTSLVLLDDVELLLLLLVDAVDKDDTELCVDEELLLKVLLELSVLDV